MTKNCQILLTLTATVCAVLTGHSAPSILPLSVVYSFTNGFSPDAAVVIGANGSFYGVTATGGPGSNGGIYEVTSNGALAKLIWLDGTNGAMPLAPLIQDKSGNFYGTASSGGVSNNGTVFMLTAAGQFNVLASFHETNGSTPMGPLVQGTNGRFYGTTYNGGSERLGTIFSVSPSGVLSNLWSFNGSDGANPVAGLIMGTNGEFYGTTEYGGANGLGTVFELNYSNMLNTLYSFTSMTGSFPGGLAVDSSNNFYGATFSGGSNFAGTFFKFTSSEKLQPLAMFDFGNGAVPNSPLTAGSADNFYGTAQQGGASGQGTVFVLNTQGFLTDLISFNGANGAHPHSGLVLGSNGNYYGTTSQGGSNGFGEIYELSGFPPYIIETPANQKYAVSHTATFLVEAGGSAPLSYQWIYDGTNNIPGATNASLVLANEQLANSGTYTVVVSNAFGTNSANAVLSVVAPTVTIISPPAIVSNSFLTISGKASGPNGLSTVLFQLNSNGWNAAAGMLDWYTNLTLQPGTNILQAQSLDAAGNPSAIKSATIFYVTLSPLTLQTTGLGSISTEFKGTNLIVDRSYTVRAVPAKGWIFFDWTGLVTATNNPLTFVMQSNTLLTANFVTNPFIAAAGTYEGLFFTSNAVAEPSSGLVSSLVVRDTGTYSGQVFIQGIRYGLNGSFNASEMSYPTINRPAAHGGQITMNLTLSSNEVTGLISGTNGGEWISTLRAERVTAPSGSTEFTMLIPPAQGAPSNSPPGYGYVLMTNHDGHVTLSGALADGGAFSQTAPIAGDGDVPFYASLYGNTGLVLGWLNLNGGLTASSLWWIKTASSASALYTNGFTNLITNVLTAAWTKPPANYLPSGVLAISNSGPALQFLVSITNGALLKEAGSPTNSLTGTLNAKTGLLKINFGNGTGKDTSTGYAAFFGDLTNAGGYFLTKTNAGTISLAP